MTIQNWELRPDRALVVCDSLASLVTPTDSYPYGFVSKAWVVAHLSCIIAVKDWALPALLLWQALFDHPLISKPSELAAAIPGMLRFLLAGQVPAERGSRVVLFGWEDGRAVGWQFDWPHFEPRAFPYQRRLVPALPPEFLDTDDWMRLAIEQQRQDRLQDASERDNIGGWLTSYELAAPDGVPTITVRNLGRLPHFDDDAAALRAVA